MEQVLQGLLHPGIFFKARGMGKGGESLRPLAVPAVPSGREAWPYRAPSAREETEETRHEARKGTCFSAPPRTGSTGCAGRAEHAHWKTGLPCEIRKAASLLRWWDGKALSTAIPSSILDPPSHRLQVSVSSTVNGVGDANVSLSCHARGKGQKTQKVRCTLLWILHTVSFGGASLPSHGWKL